MRLLGDVATEFALTGEENLGDLIKKFSDERNLHLRGDVLPAIKKSTFESIRKEQGQRLRLLDHMVSQIFCPSELPAVKSAIDKILGDYVCAELDQKYRALAPELFEIQRGISLPLPKDYLVDDGTSAQVLVTMPLFASVPFGTSNKWVYTVKTSGRIPGSFNASAITLTLAVTAPPLTTGIKTSARTAFADFAEVYAKALRLPTLGSLLLASDLQEGKLPRLPSLQVYWIPRDCDLNVDAIITPRADPDPILVSQFHGRHYLIDQWNIQGEEPYEHYLKEFQWS